MRSIRVISVLIIVSTFIVLTSGYFTNPIPPEEPSLAASPPTKSSSDKTDWLRKQKIILDVLQHVYQPNIFPKYWMEIKTFKWDSILNDFWKVSVVKEWITYWKNDLLLPKNEIFTIFNEEHRKQAIALFNLMYYAKDWNTFYKIILWSKFNVNEGMFIYALNVAVKHRKDMMDIRLPAPYEVNPYYFHSATVIQKAQQYKMQGFSGIEKINDIWTVTIPPANVTGSMNRLNMDQKLWYFTEDTEWNAQYYNYNLDYPIWMDGIEFGLIKRGEFFIKFIKQILARYNLELQSHELDEMPEFSWDQMNEWSKGYTPFLKYYNGNHFSYRPNYFTFNKKFNWQIKLIKNWEHQILEAIHWGFIVLPDGKSIDFTKPESIELLGNWIQSNIDWKYTKYSIEMWSRWILGNGGGSKINDWSMKPSVLEHYETTLRDPIIYQLYKYWMKFYWTWTDEQLPGYRLEDVSYKGVKIESIEIEKLITFFETFKSDITQALDVELPPPTDDVDWINGTESSSSPPATSPKTVSQYDGSDIQMKTSQWRLNHIPFTIKMNITSDIQEKSIVKIFIGPKYNKFGEIYELNEMREYWFEIDYFMIDLKIGKNTVTRNCHEFSWFIPDQTTYYELYKMLMTTNPPDHDPIWKNRMEEKQRYCGLPQRLMLPIGRKGGMPIQFFFIVVPFKTTGESITTSRQSSCWTDQRLNDSLSLGYPFDRKINRKYWFTSNMYYYDTFVFHKKDYVGTTPINVEEEFDHHHHQHHHYH